MERRIKRTRNAQGKSRADPPSSEKLALEIQFLTTDVTLVSFLLVSLQRTHPEEKPQNPLYQKENSNAYTFVPFFFRQSRDHSGNDQGHNDHYSNKPWFHFLRKRWSSSHNTRNGIQIRNSIKNPIVAKINVKGNFINNRIFPNTP